MATATKGVRKGIVIDGKTVPEAYFRRIEVTPNLVCVRYRRDGKWADVTWSTFHERLLGICASLEKMKFKKGDKISLFSESRPEWMMADVANMCLGLVTVPIYHSNSTEDVAYILSHSDVKMVYADDLGSCEKLREAFKITKNPIPIVSFLPPETKVKGVELIPFSEFGKTSTDKDLEKRVKTLAQSHLPDDVASLVYTSGTTGKPKGAVMLHKNFATELRVIAQELEFNDNDRTVTFLPFAHILGRVESLFPIFGGMCLTFAESVNSVAKDIGEIKPTILVSVPRIYEKIFAKIQSEVEAAGGLKKDVFHWAVKVGRIVAQKRSEKQPISALLALKFAVADKLVFSTIRAKLGGNLRLTVSGGAPLSRDLCEFFHACGIKILEGYGLTETTAAISVNRPDDYCFGTVGKLFPSAELRIAEDGEILMRGPLVFKEYYKNEEATKEVFTEDGWFCSGDIGEINERGFLKITDRKKELIVTSGGKKIAPQKLENLLKGSRFISNGMVYGDKQKYISALVTLNESEITQWAKVHGVAGGSIPELAIKPEVIQLIDGEVKTVNAALASFESIKKFTILPGDFTIESGELTPSLKVKRKVVTEKFRPMIDKMYGEDSRP